MPVSLGVFARIWKFVDHRASGDNVTRADLDTALDDFVPAINSAIDVLADATTAKNAAEAAATAAGAAGAAAGTIAGAAAAEAAAAVHSAAAAASASDAEDSAAAAAASALLLSGITATPAELNILDGATLTVTELNYVDGVTSPIQTQLDAKQAYDANTLKANVASTLTAAVVVTAEDAGTKSSGTYTPSPVNGNFKKYINGGAHTLAAPSLAGSYSMVIQVTNNASAGAITFSGFAKVIGDVLTTTNAQLFQICITKTDGGVVASVVAMQ
jgi:hypothetical protein